MSGPEHSIDGANGSGHSAVFVVVVALSAGGLKPLKCLVRGLSRGCPAAIVVAQHVRGITLLPEVLHHHTSMPVLFARRGTVLRAGCIYVCPAEQHVIVNPDAALSVSSRDRVRFFRPSADWLFESAAASFRERAFAIVLSGSQNDGSRGTIAVTRAGGSVIAQAPETCDFPQMPAAAIAAGSVQYILKPDEMALTLQALMERIDVVGHLSEWENPFGEVEATGT